jgi:phosphate transport system ATP-binding protein
MSVDGRVSIHVDKVNFYYGKTQALFNVNLEIYRNQVTALIGPSGCGKTTFLKILNRMYELIPGARMEGKVVIEGVNIHDNGANVSLLRKNVGMVFQKANPFPKSIFDNVAFGPRLHGVKNKTELEALVADSLRRAGLFEEVKDRLREPALGLSGGQQQRLCIARALAVDPKIILLDEPASALDPIAAAKLEELIQGLKSSYTIVIVTHNMQQAARCSDYTAFFYMGRLIEYDKTEAIFVTPSKRETEDYITGKFG